MTDNASDDGELATQRIWLEMLQILKFLRTKMTSVTITFATVEFSLWAGNRKRGQRYHRFYFFKCILCNLCICDANMGENLRRTKRDSHYGEIESWMLKKTLFALVSEYSDQTKCASRWLLDWKDGQRTQCKTTQPKHTRRAFCEIVSAKFE